MATEIHVNWSNALESSGDGSSGNPYGGISYGLTQQVGAQANLATLGGLIVHVHDTGNAGCRVADRALAFAGFGFTNPSTTNCITVRAGDDKRPSGAGGPQLQVNPTAGTANWDISVTGTTIDGFYFHHTGTGQTNHTFLGVGTTDGIKVRNCWFFSDPRSFGSSSRYCQYHTAALFENCLFRGGREHLTNINSSSVATVRNCGFIDQNTADTCINHPTNGLILYSSFFFNVSIATTNGATVTGAGNAIDGGTKGTVSAIWSVDGTLTSAAFNNYAAQDYRHAVGGAMIGQGSAGNSTATDMYGTTRATPDVGFHEFVAGGGSAARIAALANFYRSLRAA